MSFDGDDGVRDGRDGFPIVFVFCCLSFGFCLLSFSFVLSLSFDGDDGGLNGRAGFPIVFPQFAGQNSLINCYNVSLYSLSLYKKN